ncbi:hypothetical protein [Nocardioides stalactiti]|uniref:hypothetical protein n=1 Tax=Nocardioides stalactiti TaxID=2755356 RepID=UPI0015FEDDC1|nr:hypothetical protein [Nocardioides stalactiti]
MKLIAVASVATVAILASSAPVVADDQGLIGTSTQQKFVMRDERGDQEVYAAATTAERRAADIRRLRVLQDGRSGWIELTLRGRVRAADVHDWNAHVWLGPFDPLDHSQPAIGIEIGSDTSEVTRYEVSGPQILCGRVPTRVSNRGRTLRIRVAHACRWERARGIQAFATIEHRDGHPAVVDRTYGRSRLAWQ